MKVKIALIPFIALLALFAVTPVMAAPAIKTPLTTHLTFITGNVSPGKMWITEGNILQLMGSISTGNMTGDMSGTTVVVMDETLDMNTGMGVNHGKFVLTVVGGAYEGSYRGVITGLSLSGTFVGRGTGAVKGRIIMGSFEGEITLVDSLHLVNVDYEGIMLSPWFASM